VFLTTRTEIRLPSHERRNKKFTTDFPVTQYRTIRRVAPQHGNGLRLNAVGAEVPHLARPTPRLQAPTCPSTAPCNVATSRTRSKLIQLLTTDRPSQRSADDGRLFH